MITYVGIGGICLQSTSVSAVVEVEDWGASLDL